jgi:MtN3 and saliva related transmembrane protein
MMRVLVEVLFSGALLINAVLYVPQAIRLYRTKRSHGLSLFMFAGFSIIQVLTILHAYFEQDWVLLVGYILAFITCGAITLQLILYSNSYLIRKQRGRT